MVLYDAGHMFMQKQRKKRAEVNVSGYKLQSHLQVTSGVQAVNMKSRSHFSHVSLSFVLYFTKLPVYRPNKIDISCLLIF
jgi:hypothetical protein